MLATGTKGKTVREKILVVEDDPEYQKLTSTWLQNAG
jgi:CheY-like chemotaxis protein